MPAAISVAPSRPPISAWLLELGSPCHQVSRFQAIAPMSAAATTAVVVVVSSTRPAPIVLATAVPANAPMKLNAVAMTDRGAADQGARGDGRGDGIGRVVEAVDVVEDHRQHDGRNEHEGRRFPRRLATPRPAVTFSRAGGRAAPP